ncbi:hypothetical protein CAPTEDRAFT_185750 [Capitella teleta]|uniref:Uncharacterized protein n=1 Tax=Capitella teleta TaxID=283909 RepID=R7VM59_CAPTE|nr:hypothetical protein CAPTEDRAFT_185750 [Capitella teleta]|eukprot:ELU18270.1 hypothetical protein CAPTEDRAFT_185750 [Capitella teleta]
MIVDEASTYTLLKLELVPSVQYEIINKFHEFTCKLGQSFMIVPFAVATVPESTEGLIHFASRPEGAGSLEEKAACMLQNCAFVASKAEFWVCVQDTCATSEVDKRWIDSTHYPERRRAQIDGLDLCIRRVCHRLTGSDLKQCVRMCNPRASGMMFSTERKRWVDPILYRVDE